MVSIAINDLYPAGADLFAGSENFMTDVVDYELDTVNGGIVSEVTAATPLTPDAVAASAAATPFTPEILTTAVVFSAGYSVGKAISSLFD